MPGLTYRRSRPRPGHTGVADALELVRWCHEATQRSQTAGVTCMGGLGRSGTLAACLSAPGRRQSRPSLPSGRRADSVLIKTIAQEDSTVISAPALAISGAR